MHGQIPDDPFRPLLYHGLSTLLGLAAGDAFRGCQIVSMLAAVAFVWLVYLFGKRLYSPVAGLIAMTLVAVNPELVKAGVRAATDMLATSLALGGLYAALLLWPQAPAPRPAPRNALWISAAAGLLFGMAFVTRYTALFVTPVLLAALCAYKPESVVGRARVLRLRASMCLAFLVAASLPIAPQIILNHITFQAFFPPDNYKNVSGFWFGQDGLDPLVFFQQHTREAFLGRIAAEPWRPALASLNNIKSFLEYRLPLVLTNAQIPGFILLCVALWSLARRATRDAAARFSCAFLLLSMCGQGVAFFLYPRMMLAWLAFSLIGLSGLLATALQKRGRWGALLTVGVCVWLGSVSALGLRDYAQAHPRDELQAALRLAALPPPANATVVGTNLFLGNHVTYRYVPFIAAMQASDAEFFISRLRETLRRERAMFFITGPRAAYDTPTPPEILSAPNASLPFLRPLARVGEAVVYAVDLEKLAK